MEISNKKQFYFLVLLICITIAAFFMYQKRGNNASTANATTLTTPIPNFNERKKLLTFGLFVTPNPDQNPIDPPERFVGYHTALDIESFDDEIGKDVEVKSICDGQVVQANTADGYGGVFIHTCKIDGQDVTVLYGHLNPDTFTKKVGDQIKQGERIAVLGEKNSPESGFTRKHLHLGIHKGTEIKLLGYVQTEAELQNYIDPLPFFK